VIDPRAMLVGGVCVLGAVVLMAMPRASESTQAALTTPTASHPEWSTSVAAPKSRTVVPEGTSARDAVSESDPATPVASSGEQAASAPATIAGCLERDNDAFMLKDAAGADAPKTRSWKSGFLVKRASQVELIDEGRTFRLASHVGQRIETRGVLVDHEMRVQSLRVQGSCG
jgi:hypothetical protein